MCAVAVPFSRNITPSLIPALAASYSILMKQKYNNLSAFHRLTSAIAVRGGLDDQGQTRLNHMGLMLSSQRRLAFQDSIRETTEKKIIIHLKANPLCKITGSDQLLKEFKVVLGGDQLTRVRLQEAKNLRTLSRTREKRLEDLDPVVCELWHSKQDFLAKCFKRFYSCKSLCSKGTLSYFKVLLHRSDVNGKVKGRFQPHFQLLMDVGEGIVTEQLMEFFQMDSSSSVPHCMLEDIQTTRPSEQKQKLYEAIEAFLDHYGYCKVDNPEDTPADQCREDSVYNYCLQLCHWYIHLLQMHDTAKEGDLNRALLNCKYSIPFFYSHSKLSKYLVENVDYVLKCEHRLSPLQRLHVLEGSFVNIHGGAGKNVESDLVQEHSVCNQKTLIKSVGANKSEKSITRVTRSADAISELCSTFDKCVHLKQKSGRHAKPSLSDGDQNKIYENLRKLRPFQYSPGRQCKGFENISPLPVPAYNIQKLKTRVKEIIDAWFT